MLQTGTICCRSSDGDFLLEKSDFMRNPTESRPIVEFGWCCGGSSARGVLRTLWKVKRWRSLGYGSAVEVQMESSSRRSLKEGRLL